MNTLADWDAFLAEEQAWFDAKGTKHRFPADPARTLAHLQGESVLLAAKLDRAVREFARTARWSELDSGEIHHLCYRFNLARQALAEWQNMERSNAKALTGAPPDLDDREAFIVWMLVRVWEGLGEVYLQHWVADLLRDHPDV